MRRPSRLTLQLLQPLLIRVTPASQFAVDLLRPPFVDVFQTQGLSTLRQQVARLSTLRNWNIIAHSRPLKTMSGYLKRHHVPQIKCFVDRSSQDQVRPIDPDRRLLWRCIIDGPNLSPYHDAIVAKSPIIALLADDILSSTTSTSCIYSREVPRRPPVLLPCINEIIVGSGRTRDRSLMGCSITVTTCL